MPPRWPRKPDRADPEFRRLDDRMNFATHVAVFAASNSGLWFVETLQHRSDGWAPWLTLGWLAVLVAHGVYVFAIATYVPEPD
ncbi:MAG: 2TM domain-containing protein [Cyanobacteria bacterium]|nr:2TM domain-containing protein [Cyanobacteriota bacterium]